MVFSAFLCFCFSTWYLEPLRKAAFGTVLAWMTNCPRRIFFFMNRELSLSLSLRLTFLFVTIVPKDISDDPPPSNDFFRHQHHRRNRGSPIYTTLLTTSFSGHRCALMHVFFPYAKQPRSDVHCQRVEPSFRQCFACRQPPLLAT